MDPLPENSTDQALSPTEKWGVVFAMAMGILVVASTNMVIDLDLFHEMALFREMWNTSSVPVGGTFAYTPTRPTVVHHEWGTGAVLYYAISGSGWGLTGLMILKYLLTFGICAIGFRAAVQHGGSFLPICGLAPVALCVGGYAGFTNIRAQMFTLLFLAIQYWMMGRDIRGHRKWVWAWPILFLIWANLHAGVVAGLGLFGIYVGWQFAGDWLRNSFGTAIAQNIHRLSLLAVSPLLLCINPWGATYIPYLFRAVRMERKLIGEWQPIWKSNDMAMVAMFGIAILIAVAAAILVIGNEFRQRKQNNKADKTVILSVWQYLFPLTVVALTAILAAKHIRHVSIFAITWICFVPGLLMQSELRESLTNISQSSRRMLFKGCVAAALIGLAISCNNHFGAIRIPEVRTAELRGAPVYPVAAINYLQEKQVSGNMMVPFATGAYVSWRMHPAIQVSIDSRYEVAYPDGAVEESVAFYRMLDSSWQEMLDKYPTDLILVPTWAPVDKALTDAVANREITWKEIYRDPSYAIYSRSLEHNTASLPRF